MQKIKASKEIFSKEIFCMVIKIFNRNPLKETKNPSRYHNSRTNLKFQHKPKYHLSKILI